MENEIKGVTVDEIAEAMGLEKNLVKKYVDGPLKEDIEKEKLDLGNGKYDPFIMDLLAIEIEVDVSSKRLEKALAGVRESKGRKD